VTLLARVRSASIRTRLLLLVGAVVVPFAALYAYGGLRDYRRAQAEAREDVLAVAAEVVAGIEQFYGLSREAVSAIAEANGASLLDPAQCEAVVKSAFQGLPYFANLVVFDAEGDWVCGGEDHDGSGVNVSDRVWFEGVMSTGQFTVSAPVVGRVVDRWILPLALPLADSGGVVGALVGTLDLLRFQEILEGLDAAPDQLISIQTLDGVVVARSQDSESWVGRTIEISAVEVEEVARSEAVTRSLDVEGTMRLWGRVDLADPGWRVFVGVPEAGLYEEELAWVRANLAIGLFLFVLAVVSALWLHREVSQALTGLRQGVRDAAEGRPVTLPDGSPAEVVEVAAQLNRTLKERIRAEAAERRATERFRTIVENAVFGIFVATRHGILVEVNQALVRMLGYDSADELMVLGTQDLFAEPTGWAELLRAHPPGTPITEVEVDWVAKDARPLLVRLNGTALSTPEGESVVEIIVEDITRQRVLEEMTRHQQKMDAVGRLAGGVAHEFNNLLTVMGVNAEFLQEALHDVPALKREADEISDALDRARSLTSRLLAFSRKEIVQPTLVDLSELVRSLEGMLRKVVPDNVVVVTELAPRAGPVHIDVGQLEQALLNLVINARDAMPSGGKVWVTTGVRTGGRPGMGEEDAGYPGPCATLSVTDDGEGIDEAVRALIFEPFFTTKPVGEGTGLGLPTVYGIVHEAGGRVTVDSTPGEGASFTLWLPLAEHA